MYKNIFNNKKKLNNHEWIGHRHDNRYQNSIIMRPVFINNIIVSSLEKKNKGHPKGFIIVKEVYNKDNTLAGWAVMVKTQEKNDDGKGWFWYEVTSTSDAPATFADSPKNKQAGYSNTTIENLKNGRIIYESSCLHCHENQRYSDLRLDNSKPSFNYLLRGIASKQNNLSMYDVIRHGTDTYGAKQAYMPNFTLEKMSNQMVEDLKAYLNMSTTSN